MYENGESVLPKNENSVGLEAITLDGSSSPSRRDIASAEKTNMKKSVLELLVSVLAFRKSNLADCFNLFIIVGRQQNITPAIAMIIFL
jgi:hypothetical protein